MSKNKKNRTIEVGLHDTVIVLTADNDVRIIASEMNSQAAVEGEQAAQELREVLGHEMAMTAALAVVRGKAALIAMPMNKVIEEVKKTCDCDGCRARRDHESKNLPN